MISTRLLSNSAAPLLSLFTLYGAPVQSITGSNTLVVIALCVFVKLSLAIDCEHLIDRIN